MAANGQPTVGLRFMCVLRTAAASEGFSGNVTQCQTAVFAWQPLPNPVRRALAIAELRSQLLRLIDPLYLTFKLQRTPFSDFEPTDVYLNVRNASQVEFHVDVAAGVLLYGQIIDATGQFLQTPEPIMVQPSDDRSCIREPFDPGSKSSVGVPAAAVLGGLFVLAVALDIYLLRNAWLRRRRRRQEQRILANSRVLEGMPRRPPSHGSTVNLRGPISLDSPLSPDEAAQAVLMADTSASPEQVGRNRPTVPKIKTTSLQASPPTTLASPYGQTPSSTIQFSASPFARLRPYSVKSGVSERSDVATSYAATVAPSESLARYSSRSSRSSAATSSTDAAGFYAITPRDPFEDP